MIVLKSIDTGRYLKTHDGGFPAMVDKPREADKFHTRKAALHAVKRLEGTDFRGQTWQPQSLAEAS